MTSFTPSLIPERTTCIARARRHWIEGAGPDEAGAPASARIEPWITRSWQRCMAAGQRPEQRVDFDPVSQRRAQQLAERNRQLVLAARPVLERLSRTLADTRFFPLLTDAQGVVIDVGALPAAVDSNEQRAQAIARIGIDLSERVAGTTAIGAALAEQVPVWLHRGEHFFHDTAPYSCAGAPLFGPDGSCIGMLDLTGILVAERPELRHLAALSARSIENALLRRLPCALSLQLAWPGAWLGGDGDALLCVEADGRIVGSNAAARQMLPLAREAMAAPLQCADLFAVPLAMLFDASRRGPAQLDIPLWSGLRLQARVSEPGRDAPARGANGAAASAPRLRDVQTTLIHQAVADAHGNVAQAARALGISRATVYRKLHASRQ